ncbi:hypothetical protein Trco_004947 [Trichoderma cornu-damae]|uniref:Uncharacterized protein n=1 Tax=Trichoderma cornu-damae TaxID=654480 RepID=A0A9P8TUR6_9HYPO|nr:hypothetical protein Trco_004947 [Trichoderma cornu-damae]
MDFVKKATHKGEGQQTAQGAQGTQGTQGTTATAPQGKAQGQGQGQAQGGQKDDYVDKAFAMGSKKADYNIDRNTQEKITDTGRSMYEKATG